MFGLDLRLPDLRLFRPGDKPLNPPIYMSLSHFPTDELPYLDSRLDQFARTHLFSNFYLARSGLLVKTDKLKSTPLIAGVDLSEVVTLISELPAARPNLNGSANEELFRLPVIFKDFSFIARITLHRDYSLSLSKKELEHLAYQAELYDRLRRRPD